MTALVLLGTPAHADEPTPEPSPVVVDDGGMAGDPDCFFVPGPSDQPTAEPTAEPSAEPTDSPTDEITAEPGETVTPEATAGTTSDATLDPTQEPTEDPTQDPTPEPDPTDLPTGEPGGYWVCASSSPVEGSLGDVRHAPTLGAGGAQLPFSGAPVGRYAATGLGLVLAGAGTVLVARRRAS